jgi:C1A family cysteine protease
MDADGTEILLDPCEGAHAFCIVGYEDDDREESIARPGGGCFIFRNSWGTDWAPSNEHGRGYGQIPYDYLTRYCVDACIVTGLQPAKAAGGSARAAKENP